MPLVPWPLDRNGDEIEPRLFYIWRWWQAMSGWREQGFGLGPISHQEILAWSILYQIDVSPSEVEALKRIDIAFRNYEAEKSETQRAISADKPPPRAQSLSDMPVIGDLNIEQAKQVVAAHKAKQKKAKEAPPHG